MAQAQRRRDDRALGDELKVFHDCLLGSDAMVADSPQGGQAKRVIYSFGLTKPAKRTREIP